MATAVSATLPFHLRGNYAPVRDEIDAHDLPVIGTVPPSCEAGSSATAPTRSTDPRRTGSSATGCCTASSWATGAPAAIGTATCRPTCSGDVGPFIDDQGHIDLRVDPANTNVIGHAGRILALVENGFPYQVTPDLDTVGCFDFDGRLTTAMTAHPSSTPPRGSCTSSATGSCPPTSPTTSPTGTAP